MKPPDAPPASFEIEKSIPGIVAGIDEAGRGPLAGPVVAAAVVLDPATCPEGVRDSKLLTQKRRGELAIELWKCAHVGVGVASVDEIDALNILQATLLAMSRAAANLPVRPAACIVDGKIKPRLRCPAYAVVDGDARSFSIAAASIIAKTTRDRMMRELAREFPVYAWESNKGYACPAHLEALSLHGVTPHHRKSFSPVHNILYADASPSLC